MDLCERIARQIFKELQQQGLDTINFEDIVEQVHRFSYEIADKIAYDLESKFGIEVESD